MGRKTRRLVPAEVAPSQSFNHRDSTVLDTRGVVGGRYPEHTTDTLRNISRLNSIGVT